MMLVWIRDRRPRAKTLIPRLAALALVVWAGAPGIVLAQTPSPLQEWQYSSGTVLARLFEPDVPQWRVVLGAAMDAAPVYDGALRYRVQGGPVINIRFRDIAFASIGEGLGVNVLSGRNYRAGVALAFDLGRYMSDDYKHLHGLGDIERAPVVKFFASYVISKEFPLVFRANVRRVVGGADGWAADVEAYLPLPGSSRKLIMFAGPSVTFADSRYSQHVFGVTAAQSLASGYSVYDARAGANAVGAGFSATRFLTEHWLLNLDMAVNHLLGSGRNSPITQTTVQGVLSLSTAYLW